MELVFREQTYPFLTEKRYDLLYQEQTAETVLPETMPEITRILDTFGTVLVQSKAVENGSVRVTGGIQAGVLYLPEGEAQPERIDVWLPFSVTKKVPTEENTVLFYWGWLKSLETRFINARKVMVRACLGSELTLLTQAQLKLAQLERPCGALECRVNTYPMRLPLAAGEKELQIADEVLLPEQSPGIAKLLKASCAVRIDETRAIGEKAVFKGNLAIRILYLSEEGALAVWNTLVPFSQYAEMGREAEDGIVTVQPILRSMEIDTDGQPDSRRLLLNITVLAQVLLRGTVELRLIEDAYCLSGSLRPQWQTLELQPCLDLFERELTQELPMPEDAAELLDVTALADRTERGETGGLSGTLRVNVLYYDRERRLQGRLVTGRFTDPDAGELPEGTVCHLSGPAEPRQSGGQLRVPIRAELVCLKQMSWQNLSGGEIVPGEREEGPSLIVKTAGGDLWALARQYRTTVRAICAANQLETGQLDRERLLLIPSGAAFGGMEEDRA